ncbi:glycosyltransferase [Halorubrum lipolyticum]|uniref:Glycosyltransferase n=1 Tax=Halorubrum lipolyticum DSM 21995 TaxID=1227482 RepID=M0NLU9_9EURY|nr:glycosyltransferase [Halorubrum lipolyticum]EMA58932.1 glycosyltransferase [Halorubrum lipolyticum DSM 21995]
MFGNATLRDRLPGFLSESVDPGEGAGDDSDTGTDPDADASGPLVTAVVTTYNRPSYLRDSVESVIEQTYEPIELVVVDDCSDTPASETLADVDTDALAGYRCVRHRTNRGVNAARNTGVEAGTGAYVAFLDDDDRWVPEKLERHVDAFEAADENVGVVYSGMKAVHEDGAREELPPRIDGDLTKALLCRNVVGSMSVVTVRADVAREVPFDEEFEAWADLEWFVRVSQRVPFVRLPEALVVYEYTSHGRLSDDFEKKRCGYDSFLDRFDDAAAAYGRPFRRKMRAWAAFRAGSSALYTGNYGEARRLLFTAVARYPLEPRFLTYLLASLGGRPTHLLARGISRSLG